MRNVEGYRTKQRGLIEKALYKTQNSHITVDELTDIISLSGEKVGRTTVYRCLEKMVSEGMVRKYMPSSDGSVCYQYMPENEHCHEHYHLKCERCNRLIHVECKSIENLYGHIEAEHRFCVDGYKTVIYGICGDCLKK